MQSIANIKYNADDEQLLCKIWLFTRFIVPLPPMNVKTNSWKAWMLAARPKTLTGAAVPVMMGLAMGYSQLSSLNSQLSSFNSQLSSLNFLPALLCILFAFLMQIDANFINDYFDWRKGTDDEHRLGPRRACAEGWVTPEAMRWAIAVTTLAAAVVGFPLIFFGGFAMLWIGVACVVFCFLYTLLLSYIGLGDVLVLLFFGLVPVCTTFYLQTHTLTLDVVLASIACGLVIDTLLVVNNYRDRDNDRRVGKRTLVVLIGEKATEGLYLMLGIVAFLAGGLFLCRGHYFTCFLPAIYLFLHISTWLKMKRIRHGKALNNILAENARNMFVYGLLFSAGVVLDAFL